MSDPSNLPPEEGPPKFPWLPLYILAVLLGLLSPAVVWVYMIGLGFLIGFLVVVGGLLLSVAVLLTVSSYLAVRNEPKLSSANPKAWLCALTVQGILLLWLLSLFKVGDFTDRVGVQMSQASAQTVAATAKEFHARHGRYPVSLSEVEQDTGQSLPWSVRELHYSYHSKDNTFSLTFSGDFLEHWILNGKTGTWTKDDF